MKESTKNNFKRRYYSCIILNKQLFITQPMYHLYDGLSASARHDSEYILTKLFTLHLIFYKQTDTVILFFGINSSLERQLTTNKKKSFRLTKIQSISSQAHAPISEKFCHNCSTFCQILRPSQWDKVTQMYIQFI